MKAKTQVEDFRVIIRGLIAAYPRDNFIPNEYTFNLWYAALNDIDSRTLNKASTAYVMGNKFPPTIADIRQLAHDLATPPDDIAAEEWERLKKALGHAGSPEALEHWQRLPDITKQIVGGFSEFKEWSIIPTVNLMTVQQPMFIKRFEELTKRDRAAGAIPEQVRTPTKALEEHLPPAIESKDSSTGVHDRIEAPEDLIKKLRHRLQR